MMYNFGNCGIEYTRKIIVCEESKNKFIVNNKDNKTVLKMYVDKPKDKNINCSGLNIKGKKCDYLVIEIQKNIANFVELKGHQINQAVKQLSNSISVITNMSNNFISTNFSLINSYIVTSKVPKDVNLIKTKNKFRKDTNSKLTIKNSKIEIHI